MRVTFAQSCYPGLGVCYRDTGCQRGKEIVPDNVLGKFFKNREESRRLDF